LKAAVFYRHAGVSSRNSGILDSGGNQALWRYGSTVRDDPDPEKARRRTIQPDVSLGRKIVCPNALPPAQIKRRVYREFDGRQMVECIVDRS
jgi:hypothetical protein